MQEDYSSSENATFLRKLKLISNQLQFKVDICFTKTSRCGCMLCICMPYVQILGELYRLEKH